MSAAAAEEPGKGGCSCGCCNCCARWWCCCCSGGGKGGGGDPNEATPLLGPNSEKVARGSANAEEAKLEPPKPRPPFKGWVEQKSYWTATWSARYMEVYFEPEPKLNIYDEPGGPLVATADLTEDPKPEIDWVMNERKFVLKVSLSQPSSYYEAYVSSTPTRQDVQLRAVDVREAKRWVYALQDAMLSPGGKVSFAVQQ
uniref:PH domain-containing protein n=2 Tax=Phaeomonas parva TaxID=124430 RepID=A0A7S1Y0V6_9STRA